MNITCDIIKDLLPLYAEDMVSPDSRKLVDDHLCGCDSCVKELAELKKAPKVPVEVETGSLKRVGDTIRRRRILAVMAAVFLLATLVLSVDLFLNAKVYLTAEQAVLGCQTTENGDILIQYSNLVTGTGSLGDGDPDSEEATGNWGVTATTRVGKLLFAGKDAESFTKTYGQSFQMNAVADTQNIWYCDARTGKGAMLLWDAGNAYDGEPFMSVNNHLAVYFGIVLALAAVLLVLAWCFRGKWYGELCFRLGALAGCNGVSLLIVTAGQFLELWGEFTEGVNKALTLTVPMVLSVLFVRQIFRLKKQDKG